MTLAQVKTLIIGVLKKWFTNKSTLDKLSDNNGTLTYNGNDITSSVNVSSYTSQEITNAVNETITALNSK